MWRIPHTVWAMLQDPWHLQGGAEGAMSPLLCWVTPLVS